MLSPPEDLTGWLEDLEQVEAKKAGARDVWHWLSTCVWTVDELDPQQPIKAFPTGVCRSCVKYVGHGRETCPTCRGTIDPMEYLAKLARQWQTGTPPLLLVPKARRMRLTWLFVACHVWLAVHQAHSNVFFVSSKEEKSAELVERARGIIARLPEHGGGGRQVEHRSDPPSIRFLETGASIMGVAEGADQLRQYTATAILADEFGTWAWPRAAFSAMRPCIEGGGRLTLLSSAWPGTWAEMVRGEFLG